MIELNKRKDLDMKQILNMGLIEARHDIPQEQVKDGSVFDRALTPAELTNPTLLEEAVETNLTDLIDELADIELRLTVTGLTVALVSVINVCIRLDIDLVLLHYDRDTKQYFEQKVLTQ